MLRSRPISKQSVEIRGVSPELAILFRNIPVPLNEEL